MLKQALVQYAHVLKEIAQAHLKQNGTHPPTVVAVSPQQQAIFEIICPTVEERSERLQFIRDTIKAREFEAAVVISETRVVMTKPGDPNIGIPPENNPASQEAIIMDAQMPGYRYLVIIPFLRVNNDIVFEIEKTVDSDTDTGTRVYQPYAEIFK